MTEKIDVQDSLKNALRVMSVHGFYQTHKGIIVNLNHIMRFRREGVLMRNGDMVVVSVRKRTEVRRVFSEYIERMV
ncbi:MAG: LytTR family transcriptional regulator DNA-binding domain-containing protein [Clostridia bacterium]|nr:LytTR family transcriptional regulator DNA-binding domain-containing protein [Clostridia bacterium]